MLIISPSLRAFFWCIDIWVLTMTSACSFLTEDLTILEDCMVSLHSSLAKVLYENVTFWPFS